MSSLRLLGAAGVLALVLASPAAAHKRDHHHHKPNKDVKVQLLAFNDFHGHLQTTTTGGISIDPPPVQPKPPAPQLPTTRPAGGAAILGRYVRDLERKQRNSLSSRQAISSAAARCCRGCSMTSRPSRP